MNGRTTSIFFILLQLAIIVIYVFLARYDREASPTLLRSKSALSDIYPMFQDVHVMIFIGFGFLMTFLRKYGFSSVGFNFLLSSTLVQWGLICENLFSKGYIRISVTSLLEADILVAAVLISMGAVLGKTTPLQLAIMGVIEAMVYAGNEILQRHFQTTDIGGSMLVHVFGAYFGLAVSKVLGKANNSEHEGSTKTSDLFAMIGTLFLWVFWPSFNGALTSNDAQRRAVINTYLSIVASCVIAFAVSSWSNNKQKYDMVHIQNATLAGGVAIGTAADLVVEPYGAVIVGSLAGLLSTLGYAYLQPFLDSKFGLHDTCGVHNLHGMPGVFAGIVGAVAAALANTDNYGLSLYLIFPARAPKAFTPELTQIQVFHIEILPGENRSAGMQAAYQLLTLALTLAIAIVSGSLTGLLLRILRPWTGKVDGECYFNDQQHWHIPDDETSHEDKKEENKPVEGETLGQVNNAFI